MARQHYQKAGWAPMRCSDKTGAMTITALDRRAFAASANLATSPMKVYQQDFIHLECLS
jgi:hypothetical protein